MEILRQRPLGWQRAFGPRHFIPIARLQPRTLLRTKRDESQVYKRGPRCQSPDPAEPAWQLSGAHPELTRTWARFRMRAYTHPCPASPGQKQLGIGLNSAALKLLLRIASTFLPPPICRSQDSAIGESPFAQQVGVTGKIRTGSEFS